MAKVQIISKNTTPFAGVFNNFFNLFLSGEECAEDLQQHFRGTLEQIPGNAVASADIPSEMAANTVYLIITAMLKNFYNYLVENKVDLAPEILYEINCSLM